MNTFIVAEAGVNHNGDIRLAKKLIDVAARAGADAIKFQTFKTEALVTDSAPKAVYQMAHTMRSEPQAAMLRRLELSPRAHRTLIAYCKKQRILFMSSAFDIGSAMFLHQLGLKMFKIPSSEITNLPYLRFIGALRKRIIMSTGMARLHEVKEALQVLVAAGTPKNMITVLHCHTNYPTESKDVNLRAMLTIRDKLRVKVGYSDHTLGLEIPIAAVALGASVIEKHFTLNKNMPGPDHKASLEPQELTAMISAIRNVEAALGDGVKRPTPSEEQIMKTVRKSIVAARDIKAYELFTKENITTKRPGTGVSPMKWDQVLGRRVKRSFKRNELIEL